MNAIAATTEFATPAHYKDQLKLVRAAVAASWALEALAWLVDAFTAPLSPEFDIGEAPRNPDFPAFYC